VDHKSMKNEMGQICSRHRREKYIENFTPTTWQEQNTSKISETSVLWEFGLDSPGLW